MTRVIRQPEAVALQGHRAGFVSRLMADAIDFAVIFLLGLLTLLSLAVVHYLLTGAAFEIPAPPRWLTSAGGTVIAVAYLTAGWTTVGRTAGKQVVGLRLVGRSGRPPSLVRALLRAVLCLMFPAGLLWVLVSRRNASLQDLVLNTVVVYDWSYGAALPAERQRRP